MTFSAPIIDPRNTRRTPDWLVYVRTGSQVQVFRFASAEDAERFIKVNA